MKLWIMIIVVFVLSACIRIDRELPTHESGGSDDMRPSPCVCLQLDDYDGSGFIWTG